MIIVDGLVRVVTLDEQSRYESVIVFDLDRIESVEDGREGYSLNMVSGRRYRISRSTFLDLSDAYVHWRIT